MTTTRPGCLVPRSACDNTSRMCSMSTFMLSIVPRVSNYLKHLENNCSINGFRGSPGLRAKNEISHAFAYFATCGLLTSHQARW